MTPKWRSVGVHGQPQPEDYPVLTSAGGVLRCRDGGGGPLSHHVKWAPVELPEGDEPPPLPAPFRPMDTVPSEIGLAFVLMDTGGVIRTPCPMSWAARGWCRPDEWPYAPVTP